MRLCCPHSRALSPQVCPSCAFRCDGCSDWYPRSRRVNPSYRLTCYEDYCEGCVDEYWNDGYPRYR